MRQGAQLGQERQKTWIRTLHADLFPDTHFLPPPHMKNLFDLVVRGRTGGETESLPEG